MTSSSIILSLTHHCEFCFRIDGHGAIKVADFGMSEDMYNRNYFRRCKSEGGSEEKVPIRWMAPDSIERGIYNERTDVVRYLAVITSMLAIVVAVHT